MSRCLVLGGGGFIGSHLVCSLASDEHQSITIFDDFSRGRSDRDLTDFLEDHPNVELVEGDLTERGALDALAGDFDSVYLLAAVVGVRHAVERPHQVVFTNANVVLNVLEWLRTRPGTRLLFSSTSETYAGSLEMIEPAPIPTPEDVPLAIKDIHNPRYSYAASKIFGEAAVVAYAHSFKIKAVIVRYHNVYGPRMGYDHVIPELSLRLLRGEEPFKLYTPEATRAFCFVSDAVTASRAAIHHASAESPVFNIGNSTEEVRIGDLFDRLCGVAGLRPREVVHLPGHPGTPMRRCPDTGKAQSELSYEPAVDLEEGLVRTFDWYRSHHPDGQAPGDARLVVAPADRETMP